MLYNNVLMYKVFSKFPLFNIIESRLKVQNM
jgi:hypothetical protein